MKTDPRILANKIIKMFIDEDLSINQQLEIIKAVKERLDFCKNTGAKMQQYEMDLK